MLTASALNSSEYRRRVFLVMNTSNASSMRLTGVSAPIRPVHTVIERQEPLHRPARTESCGSLEYRLGPTAGVGAEGDRRVNKNPGGELRRAMINHVIVSLKLAAQSVQASEGITSRHLTRDRGVPSSTVAVTFASASLSL